MCLLIVLCCPLLLHAQKWAGSGVEQDTIKPRAALVDTLGLDSIQAAPTGIGYSSDSLDAPVYYTARDTIVYDIQAKRIYLYGAAEVKYKKMELRAGYIVFDMELDLATAEPYPDSSGRMAGIPNFVEGEQNFESQKMQYNFRTRRGKIFEAKSKEGDLYVTMNSVKFFGKGGEAAPSQTDDYTFSDNAFITTCDHPEPHFGIRSIKQKVVPNKVVVVGPSNLVIADVPTPVWLPFGFFPLKKGQRSGVVFPRDLEQSNDLGFGFRNVGYYWGINDRIDATLVGDIYTRGSYGIRASGRYATRYKYSGDLGIGFTLRKIDEEGLPDYRREQSYAINWTHRQDPKAHPTRTFSANVNINANNFQSNTFNDAQSVLTNTFQSNITLSKRWPGKPYSVTLNAGHSQSISGYKTSTTSGRSEPIYRHSFTAPTVNFNLQQIYPLKRKTATADTERFYEKIAFSYTGRFENRWSFLDTTQHVLSDLLGDTEYAFSHDLNLNASYNVLKYFKLTPYINYDERWYFETTRREFNPTLFIDSDTTFASDGSITSITSDTTFGVIDVRNENGFKALRTFQTGVNLNTNIYGMLQFKRGPLRAIRHTIRPRIGFNYSPNYTDPFWDYYENIQTDSRFPTETERFDVFTNPFLGRAPIGEQRLITFGFTNVFDAKVTAPRDSTKEIKKIKLINSLSVNSNYNFAADSLKLAPVSINGNTRLLKMFNVTFGADFDPYYIDPVTNTRVDRFLRNETGRFLRFTGAFFSVSSSINSRTINEIFGKKSPTAAPAPTNRNSSQQGNQNQQKQFLDNIRASYVFRVNRTYQNGRDTLIKIQTLGFSGSVNLTQNWGIVVGNFGYNFSNRTFTYPDVRFYRNLHCWEMGLSWQPTRQVYSFYLRVKPSSLDFINVPFRRNRFDDPFDF